MRSLHFSAALHIHCLLCHPTNWKAMFFSFYFYANSRDAPTSFGSCLMRAMAKFFDTDLVM
jgi:hypothetical protein